MHGLEDEAGAFGHSGKGSVTDGAAFRSPRPITLFAEPVEQRLVDLPRANACRFYLCPYPYRL